MTAPAPPRYGSVLLLAAGATFLSMLDATVANLAVPDLARDFPTAALTDLSWVISLYAVLFAALLAPAGRLADVLGRRRLYVAGVTVFTIASLLSAIAPNLPLLLAARAVQGAGAAAMIPASLAVLLVDAPAAKRALAIGAWSGAGAMAAAFGPSLGGVLVHAFGWRALFYINLPVGLALAIGARVVPGSARGGRLPDLVGTVLLGGGIGALVLGVTEGQTWHWSDPRTLACLLGGALGVAAALWRSAGHPVPALEISLWRGRTFAAANLASFLYGAALYPWLLIGVLYLTTVWRYDELRAGLAMTPGAITAAIAAVLAGRLGRISPRVGVVAGALITAAAGTYTGLKLPTHPQFLTFWLPVGLVLGVGLGLATWGTSAGAALSVSPLRFAGATGLNTTARQLGGALGIAALAALLNADPGLDGIKHVYAFCTASVLLATLAGLAIHIRPQPPAPTPQPATTAASAA